MAEHLRLPTEALVVAARLALMALALMAAETAAHTVAAAERTAAQLAPHR
jgi:hypothetical protein